MNGESMNMRPGIDPKHIVPDDFHKCGCTVKKPVECSKWEDGEYEFEGPAVVYALCNVNKSYVIVKVDDECETNWNAVWPNGKTAIECSGEFKIKYTWDACLQDEPAFGKTECTCCEEMSHGKGGL